MKKLVTMAAILGVLAFCLPAYGNILVYKTSATATLFDLTKDVPEKGKELGYLVLDIDLATQTVNEAQHVTYNVKDKTQQTLVVTVVFYDDVTGYIVADYQSYDTDAVLYGKTVDGKAVGLTGKPVAKSLSGYMLVFNAELGSGTISAKLDTKLTKDNVSSNITAVVAAIVEFLTDKGCVDHKDTTPPTPDPMTWATVPTATSDTTITMTATPATDADSLPVEYLFTNKSVSGHNSGWQISATFTDSALTADTTYVYTVKARDRAPVRNETAASTPDVNATTFKTADTTKPTPSPMKWATGGEPNALGSDSSITMIAWDANDAQGIDAYSFTCVTDGNMDSGWLDADVNADNWNHSTRTWTSTGLAPAHTYAYNVKARDNAFVANVTLPSTPDVNATTGADITPPSPDPMTWAIVPYATGASSIKMKATPALDGSPPVEYRFWYTAGYTGLARDWDTDPNFEDTDLSEYNIYGYKVEARDAELNMTQWSEAKTAQTSITIQTQINEALDERDGPPYTPVTVTIVAGTYNEDLYIYEPNVTLRSASGAASTTIQLQDDYMGIDIDYPGCTIGGSAGHGFTILGGDTSNMIDITDNTEVSYCDINSVGDAMKGVRVGTATGVTIKNNNFFTDDSDSAVYLGGGDGGYLEDILISNNTCDSSPVSWFVNFSSTDGNDITISGNITDRGILIGVGANGYVLKNLTISNNTFNHGSGIYVYESNADTDPNRLTNVDISGNTFASGSNGYALLISGIDPCDIDWATLLFTHNWILRTPGGDSYTVENDIAAVLNAELNYWGTADGPTNGCDCGLGASISDNVDFENFYTNTAMTTDANCVDIICP